jgi:hypothetical protein
MLEMFIAALIVILGMNIFIFIALNRIVKIVNKATRDYFVVKLQSYDDIIEAKSQDLDRINKEIKELELKRPTLIDDSKIRNYNIEAFSYDIKTPSYKDDKFFENYKKITTQFEVDNKKIVKEFISNIDMDSNIKYYNLINKIKKDFNFDVLYVLATLKKEEQYDVVKKALDKDGVKILEEYMNKNKRFNALTFNKYIEGLLSDNDPYIYIKVGNEEENYDNLNEYIKTVYDLKISKGLQIIYKNKLYDYSI